MALAPFHDSRKRQLMTNWTVAFPQRGSDSAPRSDKRIRYAGSACTTEEYNTIDASGNAMRKHQTKPADLERTQDMPANLATSLAKVRKIIRMERNLRRVIGGAFLFFLILLPIAAKARLSHDDTDKLLACCLLTVLAAFGAKFLCGFLLEREVVGCMAGMDDVHCLGTWIMLLGPQLRNIYSVTLKAIAREIVIGLLARLTADDAELLTSEQLRTLRWLLNCREETTEMKVAILAALGHVGNADFLPVVQQLAKERKDAAVRQAALECLPNLERIVEKQKVGETLLRASAEPAATAPETLLRPAHGGDMAEHPEQLLRACEGADSDK